MKHVELGTRNITLSKIDRLLASVHCRHGRRRLFALKLILMGATVERAAGAARTTKATIEGWLRTVRRGGIEALLEVPKYAWIERRIDAREVTRLRSEIRKALRDGVNPRLAERLTIMDRVLVESDVERAARTGRHALSTLRQWLFEMRRSGLCALISKKDYGRRIAVDLDPVKLRELAGVEADPRVARRLRALAIVADDDDLERAAKRCGVSGLALRDWARRFRVGGADALHDRQLGSGEVRRQLTAFVRRNSQAGLDALCQRVQARFGARYSRRYVAALAKQAALPL